MNPEDRELLKKTVLLEEENNDILRKMRRSMRISAFMSWVYWIFIIGSLLGAYYFIQPYLEKFMDLYGGAKSGLDASVSGVNTVIDSLKKIGQ